MVLYFLNIPYFLLIIFSFSLWSYLYSVCSSSWKEGRKEGAEETRKTANIPWVPLISQPFYWVLAPLLLA